MKANVIPWWYSTILHAIPRHSQTLAGTDWVEFYIWYSTVFHAISRHSQTLAGTDWVEFYMVFRDVPCYSKTFPDPWVLYGIPRYTMLFQGIPRPLWAPIEWSFIWYSMVFQGIPRPLRAPIEWSFIWYSAMFHAIPRHSQTLAGTDWEEFYMVFRDTPCYSKAFPDPCGHRLSGFLCDTPRCSTLFQGIPIPLLALISILDSTIFHALPMLLLCVSYAFPVFPDLFLCFSVLFLCFLKVEGVWWTSQKN